MPQVVEWPNKLGVDIGDAEVWRHKNFFRVFTETKVLRVPYAVTTNTETALALCQEQGLPRVALDDMHPQDAQALYLTTLPVQKELF